MHSFYSPNYTFKFVVQSKFQLTNIQHPKGPSCKKLHLPYFHIINVKPSNPLPPKKASYLKKSQNVQQKWSPTFRKIKLFLFFLNYTILYHLLHRSSKDNGNSCQCRSAYLLTFAWVQWGMRAFLNSVSLREHLKKHPQLKQSLLHEHKSNTRQLNLTCKLKKQ